MTIEQIASLEQFILSVFSPFALWVGGGMLGVLIAIFGANAFRRIFRI